MRSALIALAFMALVPSCAGSSSIACKPDPATGSQNCLASGGGPTGAAVTTGVAAGVFGVTGCTVNGCQLPDRCNPKTKRCETIRCNENEPCPSGYSCDLSTSLCR